MVNATPIYLGNPCAPSSRQRASGCLPYGDTDIFSDMQLIAEIHQPKVAMVPIGDRFTMGPTPPHWRSNASSSSMPSFPATTVRFVRGSECRQVRRRMKGAATKVIGREGKPVSVS